MLLNRLRLSKDGIDDFISEAIKEISTDWLIKNKMFKRKFMRE